MDQFTIKYNPFNGAEVSLENEFISETEIKELLSFLRSQGKSLVWVTIPIQHSYMVPLLTEQGFVFHLCNERALTLVCRLQSGTYAPFSPTHTAGVGGLVQRDNGDVLLVRDNMMKGKGLKLPGGYIDLGETLLKAARREVFEETGIDTAFSSIVGFVTKYPHQYQKGNFFIICRLDPLHEDINIQDTDEIELAVWKKPEEFITDETSSRFHRHLVKQCLGKQGLATTDFEFDILPVADKEMFLIR
jgi:ADP-ribose pyrophosphatase YjhB (NUDIX family)